MRLNNQITPTIPSSLHGIHQRLRKIGPDDFHLLAPWVLSPTSVVAVSTPISSLLIATLSAWLFSPRAQY